MDAERNYRPIGWLSPEGKYIECNYMEHEFHAETILKQYFNLTSDDLPENTWPSDYLINHGWAKLVINLLGGTEWDILTSHGRLTPNQYSFVKPCFDDIGNRIPLGLDAKFIYNYYNK